MSEDRFGVKVTEQDYARLAAKFEAIRQAQRAADRTVVIGRHPA